jgi:predicted glycoside hydrolase/deacetylase ChbG (UPF0249 family)
MMPHLRKVVIVNGDDFGLSPGVNRGVIEAHRNGLVTATSMIANTPFFEQSIDSLLSNPQLDPGVHLCLGPGSPVTHASSVPSLVSREGHFLGRTALWRGLVLRSIRLDEVEREWRAQVEKVLSAGVKPSHLDSHGHVHLHPRLFRLTVSMADDYSIGAVRAGRPLLRPVGKRLAVWMVLMPNWWLSHWRLTGSGVASPNWLLGVSVTGVLNRRNLGRVFRVLPHGVSELVCHAGYEDEELRRSGDPPLPGRADEVEALCETELPPDVELSTFRGQWGTSAGEHETSTEERGS